MLRLSLLLDDLLRLEGGIAVKLIDVNSALDMNTESEIVFSGLYPSNVQSRNPLDFTSSSGVMDTSHAVTTVGVRQCNSDEVLTRLGGISNKA